MLSRKAQGAGGHGGIPVLEEPNVLLYAPLNGHTNIFTGPGGVNPTYTPNGMIGASAQPTVQFDNTTSAFAEFSSSAVTGSANNTYILADTAAAANIGVTRTQISVQFWMRYNADVGNYYQLGVAGSGRAKIQARRGNSASYFYEDEGWSSTGSSSRIVGGSWYLTSGQWQHYYQAFVRNGLYYVAVDGVMRTGTSNFDATYDFDPTAWFSLGGPTPSAQRFQEVIVRNDVPYTTNFTPPTAPLLVF